MNQTIFYAACVLAGVPIGLLLQSEFEKKLRSANGTWLLFGSRSLLAILCGVLVLVPFWIAVFWGPLLLLAEVGRHYRLWVSPVANFLYLVGIVCGKYFRYLYWYRKREWA